VRRDDGAAHSLFGQAGLDWFLTGSRDRLIDRASGEFVN